MQFHTPSRSIPPLDSMNWTMTLSTIPCPIWLDDQGTGQWKWMEEVPRRTSLVPLAFSCFVLRLIGVKTEGLLDYQGRAGDYFHCTVEPSPGHIRCQTMTPLSPQPQAWAEWLVDAWTLAILCVLSGGSGMGGGVWGKRASPVLLFLDVFISLLFSLLGFSLVSLSVFCLFSKVFRASQGKENRWCSRGKEGRRLSEENTLQPPKVWQILSSSQNCLQWGRSNVVDPAEWP